MTIRKNTNRPAIFIVGDMSPMPCRNESIIEEVITMMSRKIISFILLHSTWHFPAFRRPQSSGSGLSTRSLAQRPLSARI
jgi:hypothetical protein